MINANVYRVADESYKKVFCKIIESIVNKNNNILLYLKDNDIKETDGLLWSFAQLSFVPHATKYDNYKQDQVVYLTDDAHDNANNADVIVYMHIDLIERNQFSLYKKAILILPFSYDVAEIIKCLKALQLQYSIIEQKSNGNWEKS